MVQALIAAVDGLHEIPICLQVTSSWYSLYSITTAKLKQYIPAHNSDTNIYKIRTSFEPVSTPT